MCVGSGLEVSTYLHCFDFASVDGAPVDTASEHFGITLVPKEQNIKVRPGRPPRWQRDSRARRASRSTECHQRLVTRYAVEAVPG